MATMGRSEPNVVGLIEPVTDVELLLGVSHVTNWGQKGWGPKCINTKEAGGRKNRKGEL